MWLCLRSPRPAVGDRPDWLRRPRSERHPAGSDRPQSSRITGRVDAVAPPRVVWGAEHAPPAPLFECCAVWCRVPEKERIVNNPPFVVRIEKPPGSTFGETVASARNSQSADAPIQTIRQCLVL